MRQFVLAKTRSGWNLEVEMVWLISRYMLFDFGNPLTQTHKRDVKVNSFMDPAWLSSVPMGTKNRIKIDR